MGCIEDGSIISLPLLSTLHILAWGENICWWKNNDPLLTDPSNWLYCDFPPSFLNFRCSDMLEYLLNIRLYWILFEWVFVVDTRLPSGLSMFPFREQVCFKKGWKSFLKNLQFSSDVEDWSWFSPHFDLYCSFLFAVMFVLCITQSLYVHINILSVFLMPSYVASCSLNVNLCGEILYIFLGLLLKIHLLTLDSWHQILGVMRRQSWKIPNTKLFYLIFSVNIVKDLEKNDEYFACLKIK